jgi:glycine/D-amino acid oxidase-like deaminating enzyme/nitrite reductase/ring-hydroxylating ferredoxin subunit
MSDNYHSLPGQPTSLWLATTPRTEFPSLVNDAAVDVAIVGGGIAGLTAATWLKKGGRTVAVIEAGRILEGVTGYTTAKVTSQHTLIYDYLLRQFGKEKAKAYAAANQAAIEQIAAWVDEKNIDCDFVRTEAYTYTEIPKEIDSVQKEVEAASELGLPASFTLEVPLPFKVEAAIRFDNQAKFHPRKYLLALAEGIPGDGSHIFENTRVLDIADGTPCTLGTDRATVTARDVIVTSHFPIYDKAYFFARMAPHRSYVLALRIDAAAPTGLFISSNEPFHSLRSHPTEDGELLFVGGEGHKTGQGGDTVARYQRLEAWARERFPVLSVEYRWSTQDNRTFDRVPYVGLAAQEAKHLYVATGFGGWGMTNGTAAGQLLSDLILGRENPAAGVYDPNRFKLSSAPKLIRENMNVAARFIGDRLTGADAKNLAPGSGDIVDTGQGKVAMYRDDDGVMHALSATCTHMGCLVDWNPAEKSWDCPCHGSRFSTDGKVLHGPALKDLTPVSRTD